MDIYQRLGVTKRINGAGLLTRLGGSLMAPDVLDAMRAAAGSYVDMAELQARASEIISKHTGAESGIVTGGAAAALTLATAACITRFDIARMERLPDTDGMPNEVVMFRGHRTGYDHAFRAAGARIVEIGFNDQAMGSGVRGLEAWEIAAVIGPRTAAIGYAANPSNQPSLAMVCAVARQHEIPVIVDAAARLPPKENLQRFIAEGASLVAFSGGKAIKGPQGSGILCGHRDLIAAALIQNLDMDIQLSTWEAPKALFGEHFKDGLPHHGLGRGFKVDKETIVGLLVALENFATANTGADLENKERQIEMLAKLVADLPHVQPNVLSAATTKRYPLLELKFDTDRLGFDAAEISRRLQRLAQPVHLSERQMHGGILIVDTAGLQPGDERLIAEALRKVVR